MNSVSYSKPTFVMPAPSRGIIHYAFYLTILVQYVYVFSYNFVPDLLRLSFAAILLGCHILLAPIALLARPASWNLLLLSSMLLTAVTWILPHAIGVPALVPISSIELLRNLAFPLMLIWVLTAPLVLPKTLLCWFAVIFTLLGLVLAFTGPTVYAGQTGARLASITSGFDNFHASAKVIAVQLLLLDQIRRLRMIRPLFAWSLIAVCVLLLEGYGGRNEMLLVIAYYLSMIYFHLRKDLLVRFLPVIAIGLVLVVGSIVLVIVDNPGSLGSGRIGVWSYRLWLISYRDALTLLFGSGVGTDFIWTPQWWYFEGSVAHNDYLHQMMEGGFVGLVAMGFLFGGLWLRLGDDGRAIVIGVAVNSFFANGFFQSPLLAFSLSIVLSVSLLGVASREANEAMSEMVNS